MGDLGLVAVLLVLGFADCLGSVLGLVKVVEGKVEEDGGLEPLRKLAVEAVGERDEHRGALAERLHALPRIGLGLLSPRLQTLCVLVRAVGHEEVLLLRRLFGERDAREEEQQRHGDERRVKRCCAQCSSHNPRRIYADKRAETLDRSAVMLSSTKPICANANDGTAASPQDRRRRVEAYKNASVSLKSMVMKTHFLT